MTSVKLTAEQAEGLHWQVVEVTPDYRRSIAVFGLDPKGDPIYAQRTELLEGADLLRLNEHERNEADGKRWSSGMGSDKGGNMPLVHTGRIPMNVFARDVLPRLKDKDHLSWWQRREENAPFMIRKDKR